MLERCRRSQSRLEPLTAGIPPARTTTTRRTRRVCVNIETNGAGSIRSRRRRRRMEHPYFMTYPPVYEGNPWGYNWCPNESYSSYGNFVDPLNRQNADEGYECIPIDDFIPTEEESVQKCYSNNSGQKAISELKNILMGLDSYLEEESEKMKLKNNVEPNSSEISEQQNPQNNQLFLLTDLMCDTIARLNNYISAHSKKQEQRRQMGSPPRVPPVQVLQLPVQPLILPPMYPNPLMYPQNCPSPLESESSLQSRTQFERLPWLKERKRKRPSKSVSYVHLQSRGCNTDDLDILPRILEVSNSKESSVPSKSLSPPMKDTGTTMWCPMECCRGCCGVVRSQERVHSVQEKPSEASEIPSPVKITDHYQTPILKAPPPTEDEMDGDPERFYHMPSKSIYLLGGSPQTSSYSSSCDYHANLRYCYVEEEKLQVEAEEEEQVDEDEWYRGASHKLAELELEQEYFKQMEKEKQGNTRDQQLQTDQDIASDSSVNIIVTTDKAVSTTELSGLPYKEPVKISRLYKKSSLRQRQRLKSGKCKASHKVKFEKEQQQTEGKQIFPERITIGRNQIRSEPRSNLK